jgi:hypothetical protein
MPRPTFSRAFNRDLVRRITAAAIRPALGCRDYQMHPSPLSQWRTEYAVRGDAAVTPCAPSHSKRVQ